MVDGRRELACACASGISAGRDRAEQQTMPLSIDIDTVLPADSVEFCPHPDASNIFVCGTYKLQEEQGRSPSSGVANAGQNQIRTGQCLVFEVDSEQDIISACAPLNNFMVSLALRI